jgi:oxaloacetate decarboxylase alpha subunit
MVFLKEVISFIDTTMRDGSQSNWAAGMPVGMMDAIMEDVDKVGYSALDIPINTVQFKKAVRDLKEDPWEMIRMFGKKAPNTKKGSMFGPGLRVFDSGNDNREASKLFINLLIEMGALQRVQLADNVINANNRSEFDWFLADMKTRGVEIAFGLCYYISPRHTDAFYIKNMKLAQHYGADVVYLKDAGGLLDIDNIRRMYRLMKEHCSAIPLELHSHCTTGLADAVYAEALKLGFRGVHVATPPLAEGTAQPSVLNTAENARALGFAANLDLERIERISKRLYAMAKEAGLPTFGPTRYKAAQYIHRIPGGVISNLKHQLRELHLQDRLEEVIDECVRICAETGEPHMITPYSQFVCTQAAINVALGERYKIVIDDFIRFALGAYGEDSGYLEMDQNVKEKFLSMPRAKELEAKMKMRSEEQQMPLRELRKLYGAHLSDEEFLLRYMMKGAEEIDAMREATKTHPFKTFSCLDAPILDLIAELGRQPKITPVHVKCRDKSLILMRQSEHEQEYFRGI